VASDSVGKNNPNNGPTILQNGPIGGGSPYLPSPPKGRIIFEGYGISNGPQDLITFGDSDNGTKLFSQGGIRPLADANDCAISNDNAPGAFWGLAFRCPTSISNYVGNLADGNSWLERLTVSAKSFTVPVALSNGAATATNQFAITAGTPTANRMLTISDPHGNASFGLSLGSTTITGPMSSITAGTCNTPSTGTIPLVTSSNNTLIVTPESSLSTYKGMTVDAFVSSTGTVTLEVCNFSASPITPATVNFMVRAF